MSLRAARVDAAAWATAGAVILVASWRMDRLAHLDVSPWSAPGLMPGVIGLLMIVLALTMVWQERRAGDGVPGGVSEAGSTRRVLACAALCLLFGGAALGRGLPFVPVTALFVFAFTSLFSAAQWRAQGRLRSGVVQAAVVAICVAAFVAWLFESVFLVRLP